MYLAATFTFMIKVLSFVLKYAKLIIKFENVIILGNHLCENYKQQMGIGQKKSSDGQQAHTSNHLQQFLSRISIGNLSFSFK